MTRQVAHDVLRRMASPPPAAPEDVPITSSKAIRLAITRAADKTHACALSVSSLREEVLSLEDLLKAFDPALMLLGMQVGGKLAGLAALDLNMRAALLELQTVGKILPDPPEDRPATGTDARMAQALIGSFLDHLQKTAVTTALDGWGVGYDVGDKVASTRAAGLVLEEGHYRLIRVSLDLDAGDRQAELCVALPHLAQTAGKIVAPEVLGDWESRFRSVVDGSPAQLEAILHRFKVPLHQAQSLSVGQVLPLPGCTVSSIKLMAKDGRKVATARLGQSGGMRAIRIEAAPHLEMSEMAHLPSAAGVNGVEQGFDMGGDDATMDIAEHDMPMAAPMDMTEPLSWDDEDVAGTDTEDAALDWSNEGFDPPADP